MACHPVRGPWHWGRAINGVGNDCWGQVWRTEADGSAAVIETMGPFSLDSSAYDAADARATELNGHVPSLCGCDEAMRYRALLERVEAWMRRAVPLPLARGEGPDLLADIREALRLRGGR